VTNPTLYWASSQNFMILTRLRNSRRPGPLGYETKIRAEVLAEWGASSMNSHGQSRQRHRYQRGSARKARRKIMRLHTWTRSGFMVAGSARLPAPQPIGGIDARVLPAGVIVHGQDARSAGIISSTPRICSSQ